jgi:hypothetical protein
MYPFVNCALRQQMYNCITTCCDLVLQQLLCVLSYMASNRSVGIADKTTFLLSTPRRGGRTVASSQQVGKETAPESPSEKLLGFTLTKTYPGRSPYTGPAPNQDQGGDDFWTKCPKTSQKGPNRGQLSILILPMSLIPRTEAN